MLVLGNKDDASRGHAHQVFWVPEPTYEYWINHTRSRWSWYEMGPTSRWIKQMNTEAVWCHFVSLDRSIS
jgi:hypothetical protein